MTSRAEKRRPLGTSLKWLIGCWALGALSLGSCAADRSAELPGPAVVEVEMTEYRFKYDRSGIKKGRVLFKAQNSGKSSHQMVISILSEDTPPILEQLRSSDRRVVSQLASFPPKAPGSRAALAVDLEPGRYAMVCFVADPDGKQHGTKGMASEFVVQ